MGTWPSLQKEARVACYIVFSQLLVPFDSWQLVGGCSSGHSFMLLPTMSALGYMGLIFSWVLLVLGFLAWCHGLEASRLCPVLMLLEDKG